MSQDSQKLISNRSVHINSSFVASSKLCIKSGHQCRALQKFNQLVEENIKDSFGSDHTKFMLPTFGDSFRSQRVTLLNIPLTQMMETLIHTMNKRFGSATNLPSCIFPNTLKHV
ncbi:hypothetical protein AVEN_216092-1 [Araneus ventricosus]|uniref:Uncharacterized protein n=1 Tax=Araneus ventricosus TaxID=182803 RepID=A0A4Y2STE7_ARAVE|nr:hypothetical protein AVEN_216092-1 [Araneus ventricosus]